MVGRGIPSLAPEISLLLPCSSQSEAENLTIKIFHYCGYVASSSPILQQKVEKKKRKYSITFD